jgi:hypothetical protein
MVMDMKFGINKYSEVFCRVSLFHRGLAKVIVIDKYVDFPREGNDDDDDEDDDDDDDNNNNNINVML